MRARKGQFRNCKTCGVEFYALPGQIKRGQGFFHSTSCSNRNRDTTPNLGRYAKKGAPTPKMAFKKADRTFKGTVKEYKALHYRMSLILGKPNTCVKCGKIATGRNIDWANKSGEYEEDPKDWVRLCKKCHWNYDRQFRRMGVTA